MRAAIAEIREWAPGEVVKAVEAAWLELRVEKLDRELAGLAGVRVFYG